MMLSGDSGQGESICTPHSVSKRLFHHGGSSSKRKLFAATTKISQDTYFSGEESDLGPMSPLAVTDHSENSCDSSPGRPFVSPFTTPEKNPGNLSLTTWDRLRPGSSKTKADERLSPFSALKMSTRAARSSPKRKIFQNSPKSLPSTPRRRYLDETEIGTPEREIALLFDEIIPETPQKDGSDKEDTDRIEETPRKNDGHERRLITPLGSVQRQIIVPRLHRRKSLCASDTEDTSPPDVRANSLKRYANETLISSGTKFPKIDETSSIPRARASLFREEKDDTPKATANLTLSTKSFYKTTGKRGHSLGAEWRHFEPSKKRHSLPMHSNINNNKNNNNITQQRKPPRRAKFGGLNAGVRHGIKRPKPKRHVSRVEAFKTEKQKESDSPNVSPVSIKIEEKNSENQMNRANIENTPASFAFNHVEKPPSPTIDPNKRFFKTNRTLKSHCPATVTVSNKIKLRVSDGKIALNEKHSQKSRSSRKRPRVEDMSFDTTDLTVDEPGFDTSIQKKDVDGILKVLEDDWADDDYDTMETLTALSPVKSMTGINGNVTMSPASVLSNMTSSMNIKDGPKIAATCGQDNFGEKNNVADETSSEQKKFYPLFAKGYSSNIAEDNPAKKSPRGVKRSWQMSAKGGGAEDQYQIDAGQKKFGATRCSECGVVYQLGDPEDENAHLNYHNSIKTLRFLGWKKERLISTDPFTNSRVICIEPGDPKQCWKKVEEVLAVVDRDLGLADMELNYYLDKKVYFYVRDKTILGVMVAENVTTAHRMIPDIVEMDCCSAEETPAKCGINVIWTAMSHRKQHIATKLLDTVRTSYYFGYILSLDDLAFSMPTPTGKIFAEKYTKTRSFKVYN